MAVRVPKSDHTNVFTEPISSIIFKLFLNFFSWVLLTLQGTAAQTLCVKHILVCLPVFHK